MFKKLFDSLLGNDETKQENVQQQNSSENQGQFIYDEDENEESEEIQFDSETLHGTHYSEDDFDAEVALRSEKWIAQEKAEDPNFSTKDEQNVYFNYRRDVYCEWNKINKGSDEIIRFEHANSMKYSGIATSGFVKADCRRGSGRSRRPRLRIHDRRLGDRAGSDRTQFCSGHVGRRGLRDGRGWAVQESL